MEHRVPARVGLVGNPSDGFGGAVLATVVPVLDACVTATRLDGVEIAGPHETERWPSLATWMDDASRRGIHGEQRIIGASLWTLVSHLHRTDPDLAARRGVAVSWSTTISRSVGLAGSSALAVATIDAVSASWDITLDRRICAALALSAERDVLGIAAGWQDRIVQAFGRTLLVDAATMDEVDGVSVPGVHVLDDRDAAQRTAHVVVGWSAESAASSDDYHAPLRRDPRSLAAPMAELAAVARSAMASVERGDIDALAAAVDEGWRIRQACVPLLAEHAAIVDLVRVTGVAATTPGSGGSVVAVCVDDDEVIRVLAALDAAGCGSLAFVLH